MKKFKIELLRNLEKIESCIRVMTITIGTKEIPDPNDWLAVLNQEYVDIDSKYDSMETEDAE